MDNRTDVEKAFDAWAASMRRELSGWLKTQFETYERKTACDGLSFVAENCTSDAGDAWELSVLTDMAVNMGSPEARVFLARLNQEWANEIYEHRDDCDECRAVAARDAMDERMEEVA